MDSLYQRWELSKDFVGLWMRSPTVAETEDEDVEGFNQVAEVKYNPVDRKWHWEVGSGNDYSDADALGVADSCLEAVRLVNSYLWPEDVRLAMMEAMAALSVANNWHS